MSLRISVLVDLRDRLTRGLDVIRSRIDRLREAGRRIGAIGAIAAGISFMAPIQSAAAFDTQLRDIAITAGRTGQAVEQMVTKLRRDYFQLALDTGTSSQALSAGAGTLIASGMDEALIAKLIPTVGKVATAANAEVNDIAKTAFALADTLRIPADQMEKAFAGLVVAGKAGRFELKDMAKYFPVLTAEMRKLEFTGLSAMNTLGAGLQIAMKGASDPSEAANNFKNFLTKIAAPETQKRFQNAGVDIIAVMQNAAAQGLNPIEAVLQKITTLTGISQKEVDAILQKSKAAGMSDGQALEEVRKQIAAIGAAGKLGELFGDQQVLSFLLPMLANLEEYKRIRDEIAQADSQVINADWASRMAGQEQQLKTTSELMFQITNRIGMAFGANLGWVNAFFAALLKGFEWLDSALPGSVDTIFTLVGALAALTVGAGALSVAFSILGGVFAVVFSPITLIIAGIAALVAAGYAIYRNWAWLREQAGVIWAGLADVMTAAWSGVKAAAESAWNTLMTWASGAFEGLKSLARSAWDGLGDVMHGALDGLTGSAGAIWNWISGNRDAAAAVGQHRDALAAFAGTTDQAVQKIASLGETQRNSLRFQAGEGIAAARDQATQLQADLARIAGRGWGADFQEGLDWSAQLKAGAMSLEQFQSSLLHYIETNGQYASEARKMFQVSDDLAKLRGEAERFQQTLDNIGRAGNAPQVAQVPALDTRDPAELSRAVQLVEQLRSSAPAVQSALEATLAGCRDLIAQANWADEGKRLIESVAEGVRAGTASLQGAVAAALASARAQMASAGAALGANGFSPAVAGPGMQKLGGQVTVKVDGPGQVTNVQSSNPAVPIVPDRGPMRSRD